MKYGVMSTRNLSGAERPGALLVGQLEDLLDLLEIVDPVAELPAPVVPLRVGHVLEDRRPPAHRGPTVRTERSRRVGKVHEGRFGRRAHRVLVRDRVPDLLGVQAGLGLPDVRQLLHKLYAVCMSEGL